jgi:hypothetical protein
MRLPRMLRLRNAEEKLDHRWEQPDWGVAYLSTAVHDPEGRPKDVDSTAGSEREV